MTGVNRIKINNDGICHNCSLVAPVKEYSINGQFSFDLEPSQVERQKSNKSKQKGELSLTTYCLKVLAMLELATSDLNHNLYKLSNTIGIVASLHD